MALDLKEKGNKAFKRKDTKKAKEFYQNVLETLKLLNDENANEVKRAVRLNMSLILCNEKDYEGAIE